MKYLLDTDTLIDFIQDRDETRLQISAMIEAGDEAALCAISVAELYSGLNAKDCLAWEKWLMALPYWQSAVKAAKQAGISRKTAASSGRTISVSDSLIAALANEQQATVLTSNIKDYPTKRQGDVSER